jgi:hypothetical protein
MAVVDEHFRTEFEDDVDIGALYAVSAEESRRPHDAGSASPAPSPGPRSAEPRRFLNRMLDKLRSLVRA